MKIRYIIRPRLDLFDGEGGAAPAAGAAEPGAATKPPTAPGKRSDKFANVVFGKQPEQAQPPAQEQPDKDPGQAETKEEKQKRFRSMIEGEFKDEFAEEHNKIFNRRFRDMKTVEKRARDAETALQKAQEVLDIMSARYGVTDGNIDSLRRAVEEDIDAWNKAGAPNGLTGEQQRTLTLKDLKINRLEADAKARLGQERAQRQLDQWSGEAVKMAEKFPGFDLQKESEDPQFVRMLRSGVPMEHAYKVMHLDEIMADAIATTQSTVEKRVVDNVRARGSRPQENGTAAQNAAIIKSDVSKLTKAERAEIARRAMRGDRIEF